MYLQRDIFELGQRVEIGHVLANDPEHAQNHQYTWTGKSQ
jgi:hypothetical protein